MDPPRELGMGGKGQLAQARAGLDRVHPRAECLQARHVAAATRADFQDGLPGFEDKGGSCCGRAPRRARSSRSGIRAPPSVARRGSRASLQFLGEAAIRPGGSCSSAARAAPKCACGISAAPAHASATESSPCETIRGPYRAEAARQRSRCVVNRKLRLTRVERSR